MTTASDTAANLAAPGGSSTARQALAALLVGEGTSYAGTAVHQVALPALAVLQLQATPGQIALLAFAAKLPALVASLPAGVVLDRYPIRTVLLVTDLAAATVVLAIPAAAVLGQLTMPALYAVALTLGTLSVLHSAAAMAALPRLAGPGQLHQAHARLTAAITVAGTAGAALGTLLVAAVGPARAILANAASFLVSAWCATRTRVLPVPTARGKKPPMAGEIRDGLLHSARHPLLSPLLLALAGTGFGTGLTSTYLAYYLLTTAQVGATGLGMIMAASSFGGLTGALLAPRLVRCHGPGVVLSIGLTVYALTHAAPLFAGPGLVWLVALAAAGCAQHAAACAVGTTQRSVQQSVSPPHLGARTLQTSFWVVAGSETLAAGAAGPLATLTSVPTTMLTGLVLLVLSSWVLWRSPVGRLTVMPTPVNARTGG
ncbi:MFS transporter (plasmid) [Streptomyces sp. NBC_01216]|uniref:MFS transporter n=1 Tax=Streptomyces sp. NBC_01216 TaxID=2903778 RepID=UPI002E13DC7F|nr:MFS transporter [Streptomyces sp. NBC_01216]